jgi:hypothetical protein
MIDYALLSYSTAFMEEPTVAFTQVVSTCQICGTLGPAMRIYLARTLTAVNHLLRLRPLVASRPDYAQGRQHHTHSEHENARRVRRASVGLTSCRLYCRRIVREVNVVGATSDQNGAIAFTHESIALRLKCPATGTFWAVCSLQLTITANTCLLVEQTESRTLLFF